MIDVTPLTAEQFATWSDEADERRWVELVAGKIVRLEPPDATHGLVVLNLSKALSRYVHERGDEIDGYACFELGLIIARDRCAGCHQTGGAGESPNANAPTFGEIVNRPGVTPETLAAWLRDGHNYPLEMGFRLEPHQVDSLVAYMIRWRTEAAPGS